jgi:hypothetical protein
MRTRIAIPVVTAFAAAAALGSGTLASGQTASTPKAQAAANHANAALFAVLTGRKEVDAQGNRGVGDLDGRGSFTAIVDGGRLCFGITVKNIDAPVAAHIHKGGPNTAGPIVVPLSPHPTAGDPGASSGCVTVTASLSRAILKNPRRYYANVHTGPFPGGAVRGQLFRRSNSARAAYPACAGSARDPGVAAA